VKSPSGLEISRTLAETCNPGRLALLIYDMQIGIARQIKDADVIIAKVGHMALRDCGVTAFAIAGIALEVGIEPTIRHATDLGLIPILIADACGSGNTEAGRRTLDTLKFEGNTVITDVETFTTLITQPGR
jgi:isochorismate hydrolase